MGNLEKAGIGVVVLLLGVILVVAFLGDPNDASAGLTPDKSGGGTAGAAEPKPAPGVDPGSPLARVRGAQEPSRDVVVPSRTIAEIDTPKPRKPGEIAEGPRTPAGVPDPANKEPVPGSATVDPSNTGTRPVKESAGGETRTSPAPASGFPKEVKVADGENLWKVVAREYPAALVPLMLKQVLTANGIKDPKKVRTGATLKLPPPPATDVASTPAGTAPGPGAANPPGTGERSPGRKASGPPPISAKASARPASDDFLPFDPDAGRAPAAKPSTPPAPASGDGAVVVVKKGESLTQIARRELGSAKYVKAIADLNRIRDANNLVAGTRLRMPKGGK